MAGEGINFKRGLIPSGLSKTTTRASFCIGQRQQEQPLLPNLKFLVIRNRPINNRGHGERIWKMYRKANGARYNYLFDKKFFLFIKHAVLFYETPFLHGAIATHASVQKVVNCSG
jgi:hypothetical protein